MLYSVSSDYLKEKAKGLTLTEARAKAYRMLSAHPKSKATVYIDAERKNGMRYYCSWTLMHCGKRFITHETHIDNHRILRSDGTLGIHIKTQRVYRGKTLIGYRFYAGKEPDSGTIVDSWGNPVKPKK